MDHIPRSFAAVICIRILFCQFATSKRSVGLMLCAVSDPAQGMTEGLPPGCVGGDLRSTVSAGSETVREGPGILANSPTATSDVAEFAETQAQSSAPTEFL